MSDEKTPEVTDEMIAEVLRLDEDAPAGPWTPRPWSYETRAAAVLGWPAGAVISGRADNVTLNLTAYYRTAAPALGLEVRRLRNVTRGYQAEIAGLKDTLSSMERLSETRTAAAAVLRAESESFRAQLAAERQARTDREAELERLHKELAQRELPEDAAVRHHGQGQEDALHLVAGWLRCAPTVDAVETRCRDLRVAEMTLRLAVDGPELTGPVELAQEILRLRRALDRALGDAAYQREVYEQRLARRGGEVYEQRLARRGGR